MKYIEKPKLVEAIQWTGGNPEAIKKFLGCSLLCIGEDQGFYIQTRGNVLPSRVGLQDWIVQDYFGRHVLSDKEFKTTYAEEL